MNDFDNFAHEEDDFMNALEFAYLGDGEVAYIKALSGDEAARLFPTIQDLPRDIDLFSLHGADGTPLSLSDSKAAAIANAIEHDLEPVSLH